MSTATTHAVDCTECAAPVTLARTPLLGEVIRCGDCGVELEVTALHPLAVELAPQVQEDWGE
ncbi:MAG: lysine biosynthesis protein LysW [Phycisphaerae bacterium]|nr:lysine biosynthesis protein LysW [Phycisphaerae bacterium]